MCPWSYAPAAQVVRRRAGAGRRLALGRDRRSARAGRRERRRQEHPDQGARRTAATDAGAIRIKGKPGSIARPEDAHAHGVWTVFQELTLLPWMTVAENLLLGASRAAGSDLSAAAAWRPDAEALLADLGIEHIDPLALVEDISLAERQIVEIVRAISTSPDILLLDEPTSSLVEREVRLAVPPDPAAARSRRLRDLHLASVERGPRHRRPHHRLPRRPARRHLHRDSTRTERSR